MGKLTLTEHLKACAEAYTYGNLIIDENGKPQIVG